MVLHPIKASGARHNKRLCFIAKDTTLPEHLHTLLLEKLFRVFAFIKTNQINEDVKRQWRGSDGPLINLCFALKKSPKKSDSADVSLMKA